MSLIIKINRNGILSSRIIPVAALLFFAVIAFFCVFYLFTGYYHLNSWFYSLNKYFYRSTSWSTDFFTGKTKETGNIYCIFGLINCIVLGWYSVRSLFGKDTRTGTFQKSSDLNPVTISISPVDAILTCVLIVFSTIMWFYGTSLVYPSNDEVFSAVNCAGIHPFQTVAYYMLPNNHILFNLINNLVFPVCSDKVASGRFISLVCYLGIIVIAFCWVKQIIGNRWIALMAVITISLQFPVWGFATQARGYELLLLAEWGAFISIFRYGFSSHKSWLYIMASCCIAGYFTVPAFLYYHLAIVLLGIFSQLKERKADFQFWKFQVLIVLVVFLLYLPCLCFSGMPAIAGNKYVLGYPDNKAFVADILPMISNYLDYCFFNFITPGHQVDFILFLLPFCLFFYRKNKLAHYLGWFYIFTWLSVIILTVKMSFFPIDRALTGQFSITLLVVIYTVFLLGKTTARILKLRIVKYLIPVLFLVSISLNFIFKGSIHMNHYLCHFPVNGWHDLMMDKGVKSLPSGCSVAFSDESFYLYYLCTKNGFKTTKSSTCNEDYFINMNEPFPYGIAEHYEPFNIVGDFFIYKKQ